MIFHIKANYKKIILLFAIIMSFSYAYAQERDTIKEVNIIQSNSFQYRIPNILRIPLSLKSNKKLDVFAVDNPGIYYLINGILANSENDIELYNAIKQLKRYAQNKNMQNMISYVRRFAKSTKDNEDALSIVKNRIHVDSLFYKSIFSDIDTTETKSYAENYIWNDMKILLNYFDNNESYQILKKIDTDSVPIILKSSMEDSIKFFMHNGKNQFHRFWARNIRGDSIPTWIETYENKNQIKIIMEDIPNPLQRYTVNSKIKHNINKDYYNLKHINKGNISRNFWTYYTTLDFSMSQGSYTNWSGGGDNSISLLSNFHYYLNYKKNNLSLENFIYYKLGFMKSGEEDIHINSDRFELNSKLGIKAFKKWNYAAQINILTQIFNLYNFSTSTPKVLKSNFLSPGYFTVSLGFDYKPSSKLSLLISPIAGKLVYVRDSSKINPKSYGIEAGKKYKLESGGRIEIRNKWSNLFDKILNIDNEASIFYSYESKNHYLNYDTENEERKNCPFVINWKTTFSFKINYFMSSKIYTELKYDENTSKKIQFKENFTIGFSFRL